MTRRPRKPPRDRNAPMGDAAFYDALETAMAETWDAIERIEAVRAAAPDRPEWPRKTKPMEQKNDR